MIKKQVTKEMGGEVSDSKGRRLVCIKETIAPNFGHWKPNDEITDERLIKRFSQNPNFEFRED